jgi:sulfite reductase (ferredoxin)
MSPPQWKDRLAHRMALDLAREIDIFETQIELRKQGKIDEVLFAETRLRRGAYGQRYDNGQRHDGLASRTLAYPSGGLTKGVDTVWDAPGMMRIKIPYGGLTPEQIDVIAELSEDYADGISHVTTRQDVQLHFVHIDDTPDLMRRLAAVGITTREACGNSVRNVTACPHAGVCKTEGFDVTPHAHALTYFLLGHDDVQDFGRKFKIAFSGCAHEACGLTTIHDLGFVARVENGKRGFEVYVGGGLGAVPYPAQLLEAFVPEEELLPLSQAICRVFARLGEKRNRARARMKFVVKKLGIEKLRAEVAAERERLRPDPRWTSFLTDIDARTETALRPVSSLLRRKRDSAFEGSAFESWQRTNVRAQKQPGYAAVTVTCPLGDLTGKQMRGVADIARKYTRGTVRTTIEQNLVLRWIAEGDLEAVHGELSALGLAEPGAGTIVDVVSCPGTDTCKLGIAASRGLGRELRDRLVASDVMHEEAVGDLHIKVSGCFNSCGQHHVADIGFWGVSRKVGSHAVPHFQAVLGGQWTENGKRYGLAMGAIPSKNVPAAVERLVDHYRQHRAPGEVYADYVERLGKSALRKLLADLSEVPAYDQDKSFYSDWGNPREFSIGDMGVGECAGEVVSFVQFGLAASEREIFEAQEKLDAGDVAGAAERSFSAMVQAARALTKQLHPNLGDDPQEIVGEFKSRLHETKIFHDPFAGGKFASYLFRAHQRNGNGHDALSVRQQIEEAQLFVEAAHACYGRLVAAGQAS